MNNPLTPGTTLALLQAAENQSVKSADSVKAAKNAKEIERLKQTAEDFEGVFVAEMMKPMFEGLQTEAPFGGGKGEEVFRGLLIQEYGKIMAKTGKIGIADAVKEQMILMQEQANGNGTENATTVSPVIEAQATEITEGDIR